MNQAKEDKKNMIDEIWTKILHPALHFVEMMLWHVEAPRVPHVRKADGWRHIFSASLSLCCVADPLLLLLPVSVSYHLSFGNRTKSIPTGGVLTPADDSLGRASPQASPARARGALTLRPDSLDSFLLIYLFFCSLLFGPRVQTPSTAVIFFSFSFHLLILLHCCC